MYVFAVYASHAPIQHTYCTNLNNLWINMCVLVLVGVAHAFGPVIHVQWKCEKGMAKRLLKSLRVYGCGCFSRWPCAFSALLSTAASLSLLPFLCLSPRSFFLTLKQFSDNETRYSAENNKLTSVYTILCQWGLSIAFLTVTNYIPKCDQLHS